MSFEAEVIAEGSGDWAGNRLRFETEQEAEAYAKELASRSLVTQSRVVRSFDPVTHRWDHHSGLTPVGEEVSIYSAQAARLMAEADQLRPRRPFRSPDWSGVVNARDLEDVFQAFTNVRKGDAERLAEIGYELPSLSVGDLVTFRGQTYRCESIGWSVLDAATVAAIKQSHLRVGATTGTEHGVSGDGAVSAAAAARPPTGARVGAPQNGAAPAHRQRAADIRHNGLSF